MNDRDRLIRYVRRSFEKARKERFPTVRQCARGLKLPIGEVEELADEGWPLMLTSYHAATPNTDRGPLRRTVRGKGMTRDDCRAFRSAALELNTWAQEIRRAHTPPTDRNNWSGEPNAQKVYEKHLELVKRLRAIAGSEQARLPRKAGGRRTARGQVARSDSA